MHGEACEWAAMDFVIQFGCPFALQAPWQIWLFLALPCLFSALGARLCQGSALRIVGATFFSLIRDGGLLLLISNGMLVPTNPRYDVYAAAILVMCVGSGSALGAVFGPYRGFWLWLLAALGALAGQWVYGYVPLVFLLAIWHSRRTSRCALPAA